MKLNLWGPCGAPMLSELLVCVTIKHFKVIHICFIHSILFQRVVTDLLVHREKSTNAVKSTSWGNLDKHLWINKWETVHGSWMRPKVRMAQKSMREARGIHDVTGWLLMFTHIEHHVSLLWLSLESHLTYAKSGTQNLRGSLHAPLTVSSWEGSMNEHCVTIF